MGANVGLVRPGPDSPYHFVRLGSSGITSSSSRRGRAYVHRPFRVAIVFRLTGRRGRCRERIIRIFISSPGDVADERDRARQVIESLRRRYADRFLLKPVLWEELPLQANMSFQQGIDLLLSKEHAIDIAVFILWSRLGSPLGPLIRKPDGSEYRSGTERELDLMLEARKKSSDSRPALMVYVRQDEISFDDDRLIAPSPRKLRIGTPLTIFRGMVSGPLESLKSKTDGR